MTPAEETTILVMAMRVLKNNASHEHWSEVLTYHKDADEKTVGRATRMFEDYKTRY